jgi:hypothetical protein
MYTKSEEIYKVVWFWNANRGWQGMRMKRREECNMINVENSSIYFWF